MKWKYSKLNLKQSSFKCFQNNALGLRLLIQSSLQFLNNLTQLCTHRKWRNFLRLRQLKLLGICAIFGGNKLVSACSVPYTLCLYHIIKSDDRQHCSSWQCDLLFLLFHREKALSFHSALSVLKNSALTLIELVNWVILYRWNTVKCKGKLFVFLQHDA